MKKEIDLIRAKDISQGGLTQGQQTQIARNEQRMTQVGIYADKVLSGHFSPFSFPSISLVDETGIFLPSPSSFSHSVFLLDVLLLLDHGRT